MKQESDGRQSLKDEKTIPSTRPEVRADVDHVTRAEAKDCKCTGDELKADESKASAQEHKAADDAWCCPICLSWFDMPIITPCGHSFCGECIKSVVAAAVQRQRQARAGAVRPRCPICREVFDPNSLTPNVRLFEEMIKATVVCQNGDCTVQVCPLRWKHHQSVCPALTVDCTFKGVGCDWKGARRNLPDHIKTCAYEKIKGLLPRVAVPLKNLHIKVHAMEARLAAQNATVTNMRAAIVSMQHKGRHEVLPAVYALLWRPRDWRVYSCPHPGVVLSDATFISLVPIAFLALRGLGCFGGGSPSFEQTMLYFTGLAALGFEAIVENDNTAPWHEMQQPLLLKGLRIGPTLVEISTALIAHAMIDGLPWWKKPIVVILLLAPLTYPILVQGLHRLQVKLKRSFDEAQRAQARRSGQPSPAESPKEIPLKMHGPVTTGVFCAGAMLLLGRNVVLAGQALSRIGVCVASAVLGPEGHNGRLERWRDTIAADYPDGEKEHIRELHKKYFRSMEAPFPRMTSVTARGCLASVCICIFVAIMYAFRQSLGTIGYSLMAVAFNMAYLKWEVLVGQWVMASLQQTTSRLNQDAINNNRSASFCLLRSRILVVWVMIGSMFFVLTVLTP